MCILYTNKKKKDELFRFVKKFFKKLFDYLPGFLKG